MRVRLNPLPLMTAFSAAALVILVLLGAWQWRRFEEKRLLAHVSPPVLTLEPFTPLPEGRAFVFAVRDSGPGWRVFEPVRYGERIVFVDVGYIAGAEPPDWRTARSAPALAGARGVSGITMKPRPPGPFAAPGKADQRIWYAVDLPAMAAAAGLADVEPYYVAMPYVGPTGAAEPNPFVGVRDPLPAERHLGYAITWWGLAATLVGVYLAFHARQGRFKVIR